LLLFYVIEFVKFGVVRAYCLSVLNSLHLSAAKVKNCIVCWNCLPRRIFGFKYY